ncbi:unnamed protein product [Spirodela intermedia]|uniref:Uncharacterized protein n=1 Tax=Spirodela intermedia TaxID=51605 RepID=A0A7I8KVQ8_SPIIN|nr:unnamed protein product [Spirodela intermedia]
MCVLLFVVWADRRVMSMASKALLGQRRCGGAGWRWGAWSFILRSVQQEEALHRICNLSFVSKVPSLACMTTPCPTAG